MDEQSRQVAELNKGMTERFIDRAASLSAAHLHAVIAFANAAIKGAFVLNGSAAVAVLAKVSFEEITPLGIKIIVLGGVGAVLAVLCAGISYLSQGLFADASETAAMNQVLSILGQNKADIPKCKLACGHIFRGIAAVCFLASVGVFCYGLYEFFTLLSLDCGKAAFRP